MGLFDIKRWLNRIGRDSWMSKNWVEKREKSEILRKEVVKSKKKVYLCNAKAQMAESVDALVSNTSGATHPGSIPGLGTMKSCKWLIFNTCRISLFVKTSKMVTFGHHFAKRCPFFCLFEVTNTKNIYVTKPTAHPLNKQKDYPNGSPLLCICFV